MASIKFLCPNGHQLNAPEKLVGKAGKCPKCGTAFIVPAPEEEAPHDSLEEAPETPPEASSAPSNEELPPSEQESPPEEHAPTESEQELPPEETPPPVPSKPPADVFYFLCPNGHKLNGPSSLKGKLGQCPHCGEKFRIPDDDDEPPPFLDDEFVSVPQDDEFHFLNDVDQEELPPDLLAEEDSLPGPDSEAPLDFADSEDEEQIPEIPPEMEMSLSPPVDETFDEMLDALEPVEDSAAEESPVKSAVVREAPHALCQILTKLWPTKGELGELEISLQDGETLAPDMFSPALSRRDFGVFAMYDGVHYSLLTIPWTQIQRVTLNKINQLPEGLFQK